MATGVLFTGSTYRLRATITKDGSAWDLSAASVYVILRDPDGVEVQKAATVQSPASAGVAYYVTTTTDLATRGHWTLCWRVADGSIDMRGAPVHFTVERTP